MPDVPAPRPLADEELAQVKEWVGYGAADCADLVPSLVATVEELQAEVRSLRTRLAATTTQRDGYRLALRSVDEWNDESRMDDIVVKDVSMFRMEQMSARDWWLQCYLDDNPDGDYITFHIGFDRKTREITCHVTEYPHGDHVYEISDEAYVLDAIRDSDDA